MDIKSCLPYNYQNNIIQTFQKLQKNISFPYFITFITFYYIYFIIVHIVYI